MSLIVSFQGQFRPYNISKDKSDVKSVTPTHRPSSAKKVDSNLSGAQGESPNEQALKSYEKVEKSHHQLKKIFHAKNIMTSPVRTLKQTQPITEAQSIMNYYGLRHIPILNDESILVGIVSDRDILEKLSENQKKQAIETIMTKEVLGARENTTVQELARVMLLEKFSALPIINDKDTLSGIVTQTDILKYVTNESLL